MKPLLSAVTLGKLELKNGFLVAPMTTYSSQDNGIISEDEIPYLARRGEGGFGGIITACAYVHPSGKAFKGQWGCDNDNKLDSLTSVAKAIQASGAKAILQIHHGGRQCPPELAGGECISASAIPNVREGSPTPREMTNEEVERTVQDYADAALRAKKAGFDGIEIHGANTYLIQQFVSPHSNRRTDRWNADSLLFPKTLTERIFDLVGADYPVGYRFSPEEPETPGIRLDRTFRLIDELCQFPFSFLHLSLRNYDQKSIHGDGEEPILKQVHDRIAGRSPLVAVGAILSESDVVGAVELGADAVAIARGAIYDPDWVIKYAQGTAQARNLTRETFETDVVLPKGLAVRIRDVAGWFEFAQ
jgi:2,4-dienoyl-CoA reductase-like NADH-dependent reductase (Old Yellow Enzyme family)